ncbi:MAG: hypothetical protein ACR2P9_06830 [Gammaproteobacteria bacterium]
MTSTKKYAKKSLRVLVKRVFSSSLEKPKTITYQDLAFKIDLLTKHGEGHAHEMGRVLGEMGRDLRHIEKKWGEHIPYIQSFVVRKSGKFKGLPGDGLEEFLRGYSMLSMKKKRDKVHAEYARILRFGIRWNDVLKDVGLKPIKRNSDNGPPTVQGHAGGGESPEHLALKNHVLAHPELVGCNKKYEPISEYEFPSSDKVDVLFKSPTKWVAVEVKSRVSDKLEGDYERGIYQCVKYRALLKAMRKAKRGSVPKTIKVVLLLEKRLPNKYSKTAKALGIEVIEGVSVP